MTRGLVVGRNDRHEALQNTQTRSDEAIQDKLNAIAEAMAVLMTHAAEIHNRHELRQQVAELRDAIGLEDRETA